MRVLCVPSASVYRPRTRTPSTHPTLPSLAVRAAGGTILPDDTGVTIGGWTIASLKAPIDGEAACAALRDSLSAPALPEQLFGASRVTATHAASGVVIRFDAHGALSAWRAREAGGGAHPPRVPAARAWRAAREKEIRDHAAPTLAYDWTFTAPYKGDVGVVGGGEGSSSTPVFLPSPPPASTAPP